VVNHISIRASVKKKTKQILAIDSAVFNSSTICAQIVDRVGDTGGQGVPEGKIGLG